VKALALSFDNLGEAAEIELGAIGADAPPGGHFTVTTALPVLLEALGSRDLAATFFVEGMNAEVYPDRLVEIGEAGHEVAFHAWRHERWGDLTAAEQVENLARGIAAFERLGLRVRGMRPPGGALGAGGVEVMRGAGLRYCSPVGEAARVEDGVALLPFRWRHVDAACVLAELGPPREPDEFLTALEADLEALPQDGGFMTIVLHPFMLEWLGADRLGGLLDRIAAARDDGDLQVAPCSAIAEHLLAG
jgi:peptidoglycan/xylan/chitin deacetylase (PgdA/CDA1 family)